MSQIDDLRQALILFEQIELVSGKLDKLYQLQQGRDNKIFKELLVATYDPFTMYNMKKLPESRQGGSEISLNNYNTFRLILDELSNRLIVGNEAKSVVQNFFNTLTSIEYKWYSRILTKDLNIGIQAKTINEAFPELITIFSPMLAHPLKRYPKLFRLEPKLDGIRTLSGTDTGTLLSRKGHTIVGYDQLADELKKLPKGLKVDAEIMTGNFNETLSSYSTQVSGKTGFLNVIDIVTEQEFARGISEKDYEARSKATDDLIKQLDSPYLIRIPRSEIIDTSKQGWQAIVDEEYLKFLEQGYEGTMIKDITSKYETKRSMGWQKLKPVNTYDVKVTGMANGKVGSKWEHGLGKLICDYNGLEVRVSGFKDSLHELWWNQPELIVGKWIEILGQEETDNKAGTTSVRFPRFHRIREDK